MSAVVSRPARSDELAALWPAVRAQRVFDTQETFEQFAEACAWCVRIDDRGDAAVVDRWREHLDVLAVRGLWTQQSRVVAWIGSLALLAGEREYTSLLSPLLPEHLLEPWLAAGMRVFEPLVALQAVPADVRHSTPPAGVVIERAQAADREAITAIDAESFGEFWRFSVHDLERAGRGERIVVARRDGVVVGYTLCTVSRGAGVLSRLAVAVSARRQGIAGALLADAAAYIERAGAVTLTLCTQESNEASRALYARANMTEVEERYALALLDLSGG